ncbi:helix-turn-helix transcriptional regulator [uncultured Duncaniella sp.]|uniref:helix-turn-helix domain-containing protein n=2 Tax=uncultured Duncaniella sp. TaxID=2768039 RepID=UPI00262CAB3D|nr:helix-turn-helix transcriptional regulator [uncultured Duncaniella sp.]
MITVRVFIERGKDGSYSAYMPDDNNLTYGVIGEGNTAAEAIADFNATYEAMKVSYHNRGKEFKEVEFAFSYDLPSFLVYYADLISYKGLAKLTGISAAQLSQYISGYRTPSPKTTQKIQAALHAFGNELSQLQLV